MTLPTVLHDANNVIQTEQVIPLIPEAAILELESLFSNLANSLTDKRHGPGFYIVVDSSLHPGLANGLTQLPFYNGDHHGFGILSGSQVRPVIILKEDFWSDASLSLHSRTSNAIGNPLGYLQFFRVSEHRDVPPSNFVERTKATRVVFRAMLEFSTAAEDFASGQHFRNAFKSLPGRNGGTFDLLGFVHREPFTRLRWTPARVLYSTLRGRPFTTHNDPNRVMDFAVCKFIYLLSAALHPPIPLTKSDGTGNSMLYACQAAENRGTLWRIPCFCNTNFVNRSLPRKRSHEQYTRT